MLSSCGLCLFDIYSILSLFKLIFELFKYFFVYPITLLLYLIYTGTHALGLVHYFVNVFFFNIHASWFLSLCMSGDILVKKVRTWYILVRLVTMKIGKKLFKNKKFIQSYFRLHLSKDIVNTK